MCDLIDPATTYRNCTVCKKHLPLTAFSKMASGQYGHQSQCKVCRNTSAKRKRNEGLVNPLDRRYKRNAQPFVRCADGTFLKVKPGTVAPPPAPVVNHPDLALREYLRRIARIGDVGNVVPMVRAPRPYPAHPSMEIPA